jgi:glyoxylase-like metal-dependent hydrolase (beta-lactamase superfamily II)
MSPITVKAFFDQDTFTVTYVVTDNNTKHCLILDSVLNFEISSCRTHTRSADQIIEYVQLHKLQTKWILETHVHADHLSAGQYLKKSLGGCIGISEHIKDVQKLFKGVFNENETFRDDGSQFDKLLKESDILSLGDSDIKLISTPGHTPACLSFVIDDAVFVGDTLFMPDFGTARTDFPGGDALTLFSSIQKILSLPDEYRIFTCHDYKAPGRDHFAWQSTVAQQKANNVHIKHGTSEQTFVEFRTKRDTELTLPTLILPSVQVNMRAGNFPQQEGNGISYLKLPINEMGKCSGESA